MVLIVAVVLLVLAHVAKVRAWPGARIVEAQWARARPFVSAYVRGSPATFLYLLVLSVTTWVLLGLTDQTVDSVLSEHSTNLEQLRQNPVRVLIRSAFWADGYLLLAWLVLFSLILAPAERWLGTARWLIVFVAVGAAVVGRTFTDFGHLAAVMIGFSMYPITRSAGVVPRRSGPIWQPLLVRS